MRTAQECIDCGFLITDDKCCKNRPKAAPDPQDDFVCPVEWKEYYGHDGTKVLCPFTLDKRVNWWELKGKKGTLTFREDSEI